jgi:hypothetical protein
MTVVPAIDSGDSVLIEDRVGLRPATALLRGAIRTVRRLG